MIGKILTDAINRLDNYQSTHREDVSDMLFQLEALKAHMRWMRSFWEEPTLEDLTLEDLQIKPWAERRKFHKTNTF